MARKHIRQSLKGRHVAITGGARGIGRATAEAFIAAGAHVAIGHIDEQLVQKTAADIAERTWAPSSSCPSTSPTR